MTSFATLRSLLPKAGPTERCEMCGASLHESHRHVLDPPSRRLICACDACTTLFDRHGDVKYKSVPRDARFLPGFVLSDAQWDELMIPIGLAFLVESSIEGKVQAFYPSPAGATESMLSLEAWAGIVADNPVLAAMEPDVEALLANRLGARPEYYLAPIDKCYELIGLIRKNWHGLSGGAAMWANVQAFFAGLRENANA